LKSINSLHFESPDQNFVCLFFSPVRSASHYKLILLGLITLTIYGYEHKLCSTSFCNFLRCPVIYSVLGSDILLRNIAENPSKFFSLNQKLIKNNIIYIITGSKGEE
jgi:hypothetical protein